VALHNRFEPLAGLTHRIVHTLAELLLNLPQLGPHAFADRLTESKKQVGAAGQICARLLIDGCVDYISSMNTQAETLVRHLSKSAAEAIWDDLLSKNGIPRSSVTGKCMFHQTKSSRGNQCQFGLTPLWDNELRKNTQDEVLHSEFMDMARRLIDAGKTRQQSRRS
jgi:hypothetical protein